MAPLLVNFLDGFPPRVRSCGTWKLLLDKASRANVSFYPVDVGGLGGAVTLGQPRCSPSPSPQERLACGVVQKVFMPSTTTLRVLADNTDGRTVFNTNDLGAGLRRVADDLSAYYLLGYSSTNQSNDGKYRKIEVKVTRPGLSVNARKGWVSILSFVTQRLSTGFHNLRLTLAYWR